MRALIIEDDLMVAMQIEYVLRDFGFVTVDIALSSDAAVSAATANRPDLITADIQLRPGCGVETVRKIAAPISTPVIFITADAKKVRQWMPEHMVLHKPFSEQTLTYTIAAALAC